MIDVAAHYGRAFGVWMDTISQVSAKEFGERYNRSRWGAFFTIFEPIGLISVLFVSQYALTGLPPWRDALFHATGIVPYYIFLHISQRARSLDVVRLLPRVSRFDVLVARVLVELISKIAVFSLMMVGFWYLGVQPSFPNDPIICLQAALLLAMMGLGVGFVNNGISSVFPGWMYLYAIGVRVLMMASGLMYRPENIPISFRNYIVWNPLFQAVEYFRVGFYPFFPTYLLNVDFLVFSAIGIFAFGLLLSNVTAELR